MEGDRLWAGELMKPKAKVANSFDSFERPKIHTVNLRVTDSEGIDYDVYGGDPLGCPPVPRVGDFVRYYLGRGEVASVEHSFEEYNNENRDNITVQLSNCSPTVR